MFDSSPLGSILIVDADANVSELLKCNLNSEGFGVCIIDRARDVNINTIGDMRMVIVDASDQEYSGLDLVSDIKSNPFTENIPVIVCSTIDDEDDIVQAFDRGADDFVPKPFSLRELIARIKAILRRHPRHPAAAAAAQGANAKSRPTAAIEIPDLKLYIDITTQKVVEDGIVVPLTKTEYAILIFLIRNKNSFFSRDEICMQVWKDDAGSNARVVDTNISRLRKKLGETGKYIINRYGMGYAFVDKLEK